MICQSYWKPYHWQSEHECGTCMMVLCAVRDVLSNNRRDWCRGTEGAHCIASTLARFESSGFVRVGAPKCNSCWQRRGTSPLQCGCLSRLSATAPPSLNGCGTPWLNVSRRALEDILSTYMCTFSVVTHKLNVSWHALRWTFLLVLVCGTPVQNPSASFSYT
jgi:hypothetical protein